MQYISLLRGINVGGNNIIRMADLKSAFEKMGFEGVKTYIQSGNVIFNSEEKDFLKLENLIEKQLSEQFGYVSKVVVISCEQLENTVKNAPDQFGSNPKDFRYDVIFLKFPLTPGEAMEKIMVREGVDVVYAGENVLYFSRLIAKAGQSYLNKIIGTAVYKEMTIRNWNTTTKILALCGKEL